MSQCSHGVKWGDKCRECKLAYSRWMVSQWGPAVDEAREFLADAALEQMRELREREVKA